MFLALVRWLDSDTVSFLEWFQVSSLLVIVLDLLVLLLVHACLLIRYSLWFQKLWVNWEQGLCSPVHKTLNWAC